jgi:hypothetical protein
MNDKAARSGRLATITISCAKCNPEAGLRSYGGEQAQQCPHCGHISPSPLHLRRHVMRECCGTLGRGTLRRAA